MIWIRRRKLGIGELVCQRMCGLKEKRETNRQLRNFERQKYVEIFENKFYRQNKLFAGAQRSGLL